MLAHRLTQNPAFSLALSILIVAALLAGPTPPAVRALSPDIVISQVYGGGGNSGATYTNDFVELFNRGTSTVSLTGWSIQYASATGTGNFGSTTALITPLSGSLAPGQYLLIQEAQGSGGTTPLPTPDVTDSTPINMSATGGKVALVNIATGLACNGGSTPCSPAQLAQIVDLVGWGGANFYETSPAPATSDTTAVLRKTNGCAETDDNSANFAAAAPAPRNTASPLNPCPPEAAPAVDSTSPSDGAADVPVNADLTITFTEPVNVSGASFVLSCSVSGNHTAVISEGPTSFTLNPDTDFVPGDSCTLTVLAAQVADQDSNDPPDTMTADFTVGFSTLDVCTLAYTPAYSIQGSGANAAITGAVTTQGVVVGDYEGASPTLRGFYLQDLTGDGDPATSDAIFVFNGSNNSVSLGQVVRVTGSAAEFQGQTQISASSIVNCGAGAVAPVDVTFPVPSADYLERFEGMLVRLPQTLYVTEHFQLGRFGQVVMSSDGRLQQPTNVTTPGAAALAMQAANDLNRIIIDDALNNQNPDPILFGRQGNPLSASNTLRGGDTATGIVGVMTYTWAGNSASGNAYRVRPINTLGGGIPYFEPANPRPASVPDVGGSLRVAGMNLLNFFNTFDGLPDTVDNCTNGFGGAATDCRGADTAAEFDRQWLKTVAAIVGTQADVIGVIEIENDGYGPDSAIQFLVDRLNAATAPGAYAFIDVDAATGQLNALGTDAIKVGLIYKPAKVTPVGTTAALNSTDFVNGGDSFPRNRPALAQAFEEVSTSARFVVSVNHLKSKGSACDAPDAGDGQGNCNIVRTNAANLLTAWLASDPTGVGDPDALIIGDLNSYATEEPITAIENAGYTNLIESFIGPDAYSYVFDGQWGYLDHALGSTSLVSQIAGVADWHINADEPSVLDYNTDFKTAGLIASLYAPDEFRISDHDPVLIGLDLNDPPGVDAGGPYTADEGSAVTVSAVGSDPNGDALTYAWDLDDNGTFETSGQSVIFSAAGLDGPSAHTIAVQVTDNGGLSATAQTTVDVQNVAPGISAVSSDGPVNEGASAAITVTAADVAGALDPLAYEFDCNNDGTYEAGPQSANTASCAFGDNGSFTVNVRVNDGDGGAAAGSTVATVNNVAPVVDTPSLSPEPSTEGTPATASATFSDAGASDGPFTCAMNYGDGSGDLPGAVSGNTCTGPAHIYDAFGAYTVTVTVTDKDGGVGSNSAAHTVNYNFTGFYSPVRNLPEFNVVRAGRVLLVSFSLDGFKGRHIFAEGYPMSQEIPCDSTDVVEGTDPTTPPGAHGLLYLSFADRYIYFWKTDRDWAGTCRQLVVNLDDGSYHWANFKFK